MKTKSIIARSFPIAAFAILQGAAALLLSGCIAPDSSGGLSPASQARLQREVNRDLALEEIQRLRDQMESMQRQFSSIDQRFSAIEQNIQQVELRSRDLASNSNSVAPADLRRIEQEIVQLRADRARDRQEIVQAATDAVNKVLASHPSLKATRTQAAPPANNVKYVEVELGEGDTLTIVAQAFGTTVAEIVRINGIKDPNKVSKGQKIKVPQS